jgi:hypothetical protein
MVSGWFRANWPGTVSSQPQRPQQLIVPALKPARTVIDGAANAIEPSLWLASYEDFRAIYAHAREVGLDHFAELTLAEAEDETAPEKSQLARLKWDARRWHLSKMLPRKYGERITQEHIGADGAPIGVNALVANLTPPQIAAGIRALLIKTATDMGLPMLPKSASDADRVSAIINSGKVLPPPMYSIIHGEMPPALALSWV